MFCVGLERESFDSEHETASPVLVGKPTHGRHMSTASASRDSGLTCSDDALSPSADEQRTLERSETHDAIPPRSAGRIASTMQTDSIAPSATYHKSVTISDDSMLGSPDELSTENSDWDDITLRRRHMSVGTGAMRLHSFENDSTSRGLASAFYAQRPKSFDVDTKELIDDFEPDSVLEEHTLERGVTQLGPKGNGNRQTLERTNAVEELTPVNSRRYKPETTIRDDDFVHDRKPRSHDAGGTSVRSGSASNPPTGADVELCRRVSGRRSADAVSDRQRSSSEEAVLHKELLRNDLNSVDRQQIKMNLARMLYQKSKVIYNSQQNLARQMSQSPDGYLSKSPKSPPNSPEGYLSKSLSKSPEGFLSKSLPKSSEGRVSTSPPRTAPSKLILSSGQQNRSSPVSAVPQRNFAEALPHGSPKLRILPQEERERSSSARSGNLTVTVSPANPPCDMVHEIQQSAKKPATGESPLVDGRRRFQRKHLMVVDISSSGSERSESPQPSFRQGGGSRRRIVRRRASDRNKHRYSDPKVDGSKVSSRPYVNGGVNLGRSRSDASDVISRMSKTTSDHIVPRANESVSLLVTGGPLDRRVIVNSSENLSSDSTFTGNEPKVERRQTYTMKDRQWHRELVNQYQEPTYQGRQTTNSTPWNVPRPRYSSKVTVQSHEVTARPITSRATTTTDLHKPGSSLRVLHSTQYQTGKKDARPQDLSCPRYDVSEAGRHRGSSEKARDCQRVPYSLMTAASSDGRTSRRPSLTVGLALDIPKPRLASHKPRPAIETRRPSNPVLDLPNINWSVTKLCEHYSGGGACASSANQTSSVTTVKVDRTTESKPFLSRIGAVQRLL